MSKTLTIMSDLSPHEVAQRLESVDYIYVKQGERFSPLARVSQSAEDNKYIFSLRLQPLEQEAPPDAPVLYGTIYPKENRTYIDIETESTEIPKGQQVAIGLSGLLMLCTVCSSGITSLLVGLGAFMGGGIAIAQSQHTEVTYLQDVVRVCAGREPVYHKQRLNIP